MSAAIAPAPGKSDPEEMLWFLGTLARIKLDGEQTNGRFALWDAVLPRDAAPPLLHSHPQDETFYVLEGEVTVWIVEPGLADDPGSPPAWVESCARLCRPGATTYSPGGVPHTFRVESDTARMLVLSTPAGIEDMVRGLAEPAKWPWLQPPADGPPSRPSGWRPSNATRAWSGTGHVHRSCDAPDDQVRRTIAAAPSSARNSCSSQSPNTRKPTSA